MKRTIHTAVAVAASLAAAFGTAATAATAERFRVRLQVVEACTVVQTSTVSVSCNLRSPYRIQAIQGVSATSMAGPVIMLEVFF